ncbi:low-specificity L-threonine aldolase [Alteromonadaceae bacterium M269]|nr:low-specificity L-threonine aldolase [Alteromonadaceae bacterium M269]
MSVIDLRSDTVTVPTPSMREAMANAGVGDDVYGEDPTIIELQNLAASMAGMEAALYVPTGTQSNLLALFAHCERGEEYIVGQHAHTYRYEGGGASILGSVQAQPIELEDDGTLSLAKVESYIKPDDPHFVKTKLLCLENTQAGKALPLDYLAQAREFVDKHKLGLHLDGARVFNAVVKQQTTLKDITQHFDSVSICLSKGLAAPVGSVLCGSQELINKAHRWRKVLGGGMRQAGVIAAAGIVALNEMVERLADDHDHAQMLAQGIKDITGLSVDLDAVQTNMVFVDFEQSKRENILSQFAEQNIKIGFLGEQMRLVLHKDVASEDIERVIQCFKGLKL